MERAKSIGIEDCYESLLYTAHDFSPPTLNAHTHASARNAGVLKCPWTMSVERRVYLFAPSELRFKNLWRWTALDGK